MYSVLYTQSRQSSKLFSSRRNWDSPNPSPSGECAPPHWFRGGGAHSQARKGLGESQFRRGETLYSKYTVVLCIYLYFVTKAATRPWNGKIQMLLFYTFLQLSSGKAKVISLHWKTRNLVLKNYSLDNGSGGWNGWDDSDGWGLHHATGISQSAWTVAPQSVLNDL